MATQIAPPPQPPSGFGLDNIPAAGPAFGAEGDWGPMWNQALLTCVPAAFIHSIMHWTHAATGVMAPFIEEDARTLYSTLTGYVIGDPSTDRGTNDFVGFDYWMNTGITDDNGVNHKLLELYQIPTGDVAALAQATYLCGAVYVGFFDTTQWNQTHLFSDVWDRLTFPAFTGNGHTAPVIGRSTNGNFIVPSFGGIHLIQLTPAGYRQLNSGAYAMVSEDWINPGTGKAPNGYTLRQIRQYMQALAIGEVATARFAGTGTLTATVGKTGDSITAALTGSGSLAATVAKTRDSITASLAGSGTLTATATKASDSTTALLTGAGSLTATAAKASDSTAASLTGAGTLTAAVGVGVTATLTGTGTLSGTAVKTSDSAAAALTGAGTLSGTAVESDANFSSVVALLHLNGVNGSTTFTDSSSLASNFTVVNSTPTISTTQSQFGGASLSTTANTQVGAAAAASNFTFGTADFTIEFWLYAASFSGSQIIYDQRPAGTNGLYPTIYSSAGSIRYLVNNANAISGGSMSTSAWHHIAISRVSGSTKMFLDGTQTGSTLVDSNNYLNPTGRPYLGSAFSVGGGVAGFIDELRITKGVGRYSGTFTPRTAAFPNV